MLYTLNICNSIYQLYLNKAGGGKRTFIWKSRKITWQVSTGPSPSLCLVFYCDVLRTRDFPHISFCFAYVVGWLVGWLVGWKNGKLFSLESVQEPISMTLNNWKLTDDLGEFDRPETSLSKTPVKTNNRWWVSRTLHCTLHYSVHCIE